MNGYDKILSRRFYSPSLKDVVWLDDAQLIFLIFHTFLCIFSPRTVSYAAIETSTSPTRANSGHLTMFCARGVGNSICKAFPGWGFDFCLGVVGKIEPEVSGLIFFSVAEVANSYEHVFQRDGIN